MLSDADLIPEPTLPCKVCNKLFGSRQTLLRHSMVHTGKKPYGCTMCSARFRCTSHLKRHERQHTGERPCRCPLCPKAYTDNPNLLRHMTLVHGSRAYACRLCPSTYALERELQSHIIAEHRNTISNLAEDASATPQAAPDGGHALAMVRRLCRPEDPAQDDDAAGGKLASLLPLRRGRGRPKGAKNAPRVRPISAARAASPEDGDEAGAELAGDDIPTIDVSASVPAHAAVPEGDDEDAVAGPMIGPAPAPTAPAGPAPAPAPAPASVPVAFEPAAYSRDVGCQVTPPESPEGPAAASTEPSPAPNAAAGPGPLAGRPVGVPAVFPAAPGVPPMPMPPMPPWSQMGYYPYGPMVADPVMAQMLQSHWALMSHYASMGDYGMMAFMGPTGQMAFPGGPPRPGQPAPGGSWPHVGK